MLMQMAIMIGVLGAVTEIGLVHKIKIIDRLYTKGGLGLDGYIWNYLGSLLLSIIQGKAFGAGGLVIAMASVVGGGVSQGYFELEKYIQKHYKDATVLDYLKRMKEENAEALALGMKKTIETGKELIAFIKAIINFVLWLPRKIKQFRLFYQSKKTAIRTSLNFSS